MQIWSTPARPDLSTSASDLYTCSGQKNVSSSLASRGDFIDKFVFRYYWTECYAMVCYAMFIYSRVYSVQGVIMQCTLHILHILQTFRVTTLCYAMFIY